MKMPKPNITLTLRFAAIILLMAFSCAQRALAAPTEKISEIYPTGEIFREYRVDDKGQRTGPYIEYHLNGETKVKANYINDKLTGLYNRFHPDGQLAEQTKYRNGQRHGERKTYDTNRQLLSDEYYIEDALIFPKSKTQIERTFTTINALNDLGPGDPNVQRAIKRLMQYRYLCDLPYADLRLDARYNQLATAGAQLCKAIRRLDHTPPNPGLPEEEYKLGYQGTSRSNLSLGSTVYGSVDSYMNDSDRSNIDRVGHRRWCLNPAMLKTGFGYAGKYSAMYAFDNNRKDIPDYEFIAYPPRGYTPLTHFKSNYAWSITLNPKKYLKPSKTDTKITVREVRSNQMNLQALARGRKLSLNYQNIELSGFGIANCIIFRPSVDLKPGQRYWVTIEGIKTKKQEPVTIEYLVEFY